MQVRVSDKVRGLCLVGSGRARVVEFSYNWSIVTADEVAKLIGAAPCKTCSLDPIPTWLVKEMRGLLSPFISLLNQKSLSTGLFPTEFKEAIVRPLLKKSGLDSTQKKNYRPVSNLSFLYKLF